jgi:hypothetical protein
LVAVVLAGVAALARRTAAWWVNWITASTSASGKPSLDAE